VLTYKEAAINYVYGGLLRISMRFWSSIMFRAR